MNSYTLLPLYGHRVELYTGVGSTGTLQRRHDSDRWDSLVGGYGDYQA